MGKASLDQAISTTKTTFDVQVKWSPFFLRPNMPAEGVECGSLRGDGSGSRAPSGPYWHSRNDRAAQLGIDMSGGVARNRFPNTTLAHVLLTWAYDQDPESQHALAELIFEAFYSKEIYLDAANLSLLADKAGYDADAARRHLDSKRGEARVKSEARQAGVSGVPYFIINGEGVFSGAQDPQAFIHAFAKAAQERPLPPRCPKILDKASLDAMSIKELKRLLLEGGANPITVREYVEKSEFREAIMTRQRSDLERLEPKRLKAMLQKKGIVDQRRFTGAEKSELIRAVLQDDNLEMSQDQDQDQVDKLQMSDGSDGEADRCSGGMCEW